MWLQEAQEHCCCCRRSHNDETPHPSTSFVFTKMSLTTSLVVLVVVIVATPSSFLCHHCQRHAGLGSCGMTTTAASWWCWTTHDDSWRFNRSSMLCPSSTLLTTPSSSVVTSAVVVVIAEWGCQMLICLATTPRRWSKSKACPRLLCAPRSTWSSLGGGSFAHFTSVSLSNRSTKGVQADACNDRKTPQWWLDWQHTIMLSPLNGWLIGV